MGVHIRMRVLVRVRVRKHVRVRASIVGGSGAPRRGRQVARALRVVRLAPHGAARAAASHLHLGWRHAHVPHAQRQARRARSAA
eukprot:5173762-Pleurochrysis_carterae.AAC.1